MGVGEMALTPLSIPVTESVFDFGEDDVEQC